MAPMKITETQMDKRMEHENAIRMTKGFQCQGPPGNLN